MSEQEHERRKIVEWLIDAYNRPPWLNRTARSSSFSLFLFFFLLPAASRARIELANQGHRGEKKKKKEKHFRILSRRWVTTSRAPQGITWQWNVPAVTLPTIVPLWRVANCRCRLTGRVHLRLQNNRSWLIHRNSFLPALPRMISNSFFRDIKLFLSRLFRNYANDPSSKTSGYRSGKLASKKWK